MLKKLIRFIRPNPLDALLTKALKKNHKKILLGWNRGMGDIPLGLYALVQKIKWYIPDAQITFMTRTSLQEPFSLFPEVNTIFTNWQRDELYDVKETLKELNIVNDFDLIINWPDPTYWLKSQHGFIIPRLSWNVKNDLLCEKFSLDKNQNYIAVQINSDTIHSPWRDWPNERWIEFFDQLDKKKNLKAIIFGINKSHHYSNSSVIDLRGKTTILELLSIIKNRCSFALLPDGGILSLLYFLNINFPIKVISLWSDIQGVLKQRVNSPNSKLVHIPLLENKNIAKISVNQVISHLEFK